MDQPILTDAQMSKKCTNCGFTRGKHNRKTDACPVYDDANPERMVGFDKFSSFEESNDSVSPVGIPFLYRYRIGEKTIFVVTVSRCIDFMSYDVSWMNENIILMGEDDSVYVPDVDIKKDSFIFNSGDAATDFHNALDKMKEMWSKVRY